VGVGFQKVAGDSRRASWGVQDSSVMIWIAAAGSLDTNLKVQNNHTKAVYHESLHGGVKAPFNVAQLLTKFGLK
jgi:hypothetical protein